MATLDQLKEDRKQKKSTSIPASALSGGPVSAAVLAKLRAHAEEKGWVQGTQKAWDPKDTPADVFAGDIRGAGRELLNSKNFEICLSGGFETAKTWSCCKKINAFLWKYPGAQWVMTRKTYSSLIATAVQTYERVAGIGNQDCKIRPYGGNKPEWYDYPNGSRLWIAGFDNPQKVLSGERDGFYINQGEEFGLEEYETITGRATGRGAVMPYTQVILDVNPGPPSHWILSRPSLKLIKAYLDDNPTLWNPAPAGTLEVSEEWPDIGDRGGIGCWTEQGRRSIEILDKLTGIRYQRYRKGNWVAAEGVVYENFDREKHTCEPFPIPADWTKIRIIDFGYTNPFVCLWVAIDPDGRMYLYREIYMTQMLVSTAARQIIDLSGDEKINVTICDHDAEDRATLAAVGIKSIPAWKKVKPGLDAVENRLKIAGDGEPRLKIFRNSTCVDPYRWTFPRSMPDPYLTEKKVPYCTAQEFEFYVWHKDATGKPNKEEPVKEFDHGLDALRYGVCYVDNVAKTTNRVTRSSTGNSRRYSFA